MYRGVDPIPCDTEAELSTFGRSFLEVPFGTGSRSVVARLSVTPLDWLSRVYDPRYRSLSMWAHEGIRAGVKTSRRGVRRSLDSVHYS